MKSFAVLFYRNQSATIAPPPSAASPSRHSLMRSSSQETLAVTDDIDQDQDAKYDTVHILNRYSAPIAKDYSSENEDGVYKIRYSNQQGRSYSIQLDLRNGFNVYCVLIALTQPKPYTSTH